MTWGYGIVAKSLVEKGRWLIHVVLLHHVAFLDLLVLVHWILRRDALASLVVLSPNLRLVLSLLKLHKWSEQDLLRILQRHESVLSLSACKDADVADDERLARSLLHKLLLTWHLASTTHRRH